MVTGRAYKGIKILCTLLLSIVLVITAVPADSFADSTESISVVSLEVDDVVLLEGVGYEQGYEDNYYLFYDYQPNMIKVKLNNGQEYYDDAWNIRNILFEDYGVELEYSWSSDIEQSYESQWTPGTYQCTFEFGNMATNYTATIIENPIARVQVDDIVRVEGDTDDMWFWDDENEEEIVFQGYRSYPEAVTVTLKDGTKYEGNVSDVDDQVKSKLGVTWIGYTNYEIDKQSPDNLWMVGSHKCRFEFGGQIADYNVKVIENPILSIEASDKSILEGNTITSSYWDEESESEIEFEWYPSYPLEATVTMKDGTKYTDYPQQIVNEINSKYGLSLQWYDYAEDEQTPDNKWGVGDHKCFLNIAGTEAEYSVKIIRNPVKEIHVDNKTIIKGDTVKGNYWDEEDNYISYQRYDTEPTSVSVVFTDGSEYTGELSQVISKLNNEKDVRVSFGVEEEIPQTPDNVWGVGIYNCQLILAGKKATYQVEIIEENPIISIEVDDRIYYEGDTNMDSYWNGEDDIEYPSYDSWPSSIRVITEKKTYSGWPYDVIKGLKRDLDIDISEQKTEYNKQTPDNLWGVGTYKCNLTIGGVSADYNIHIISNPVKSITAKDVTLKEGEKTVDTYRWDSSSGQWVFDSYIYDWYPKEVNVVMKNGNKYSGKIEDVIEKIRTTEKTNIDWRSGTSDPVEDWTVGTYACELTIGGSKASYNVIIEPAAAGIPGDVNMDTKVNFQDVTTLLKHVKKKPLDKVDLKAVDADGNGKVNFQDVTVLLKYVKKKVNVIFYDGKSYAR